MSKPAQIRTYTPEEVAQVYQVSKNTVYKMIQSGQIMAKRINERNYRIPASELYWVTGGVDADLERLEEQDMAVLTDETRTLLQSIRQENETSFL